MFMIMPGQREGPASIEVPGSGSERREQTRSRVKKACNRCRVKKIKCDGRIPCTRCEKDRIACKADYGTGAVKELSRNYIASLEEQQLSLLGALKELHRQAPSDAAIHDTMIRLQARGFDVGPVTPQTVTGPTDVAKLDSGSQLGPSNPVTWNCHEFAAGNLETLLAQPGTPQAVSDFLWNFSEVQNVQEPMPLSDQDGYLDPSMLQETTMNPTMPNRLSQNFY